MFKINNNKNNNSNNGDDDDEICERVSQYSNFSCIKYELQTEREREKENRFDY